MINLMLDIESLGVGGRCAVLSAAIVPFELYSDQIYTDCTFYERISVSHSLNEGFTQRDDTVKFWSIQPKNIREREFGGTNDIRQFCTLFSNYLDKTVRKRWKTFQIWASAAKLDFGCLYNLYEHIDEKFPIPYTAERCTRTIRALTKEVCPVPKDKITTHHPIDDCVEQIKDLRNQFKYIQILGLSNPPTGGSGVPDKITYIKHL